MDALTRDWDIPTREERLTRYRNNFPVPDGQTVCQGHADACELWGHATWIVDHVDQGVCPRCNTVTQ